MVRESRLVFRVLTVLTLLFIVCGYSFAQATSQATTQPTTQKAPKAQVKMIAHIRLAGQILEAPRGYAFFGDTGKKGTLQDWLRRLAKVRKDDNIDVVALEIDSLSLNLAQGQELADAIKRLNKIKPVYIHITGGGIAKFLIASAGRELAMEPSGTLEIIGLGAELLYFSGLLNRLHIKPQMIQIGRFKGAAEPLTCVKPSKEIIETYNWILDDLYAQLCEMIAHQRKLKIAAVKKAIDRGPLPAKLALKLKFVDRLVEKLDWRNHIHKTVSSKGAEVCWLDNFGMESRRAADLSNPFTLFKILMGGDTGDAIREPSIAIIHAEGTIVMGPSREGITGQKSVGERTLIKCLKRVTDNDRIKAVVLRIDSPGGSALASELMYQTIKKCADKKPVIVSVSRMAASGGYYISVGAKTIVADSTAIIGSIGVIYGKIPLSGLMEWAGITRYEMSRGKNAGLGLSRPWNKRELGVIHKLGRNCYDNFVRRVKKSRGSKIKDIAKVAQGRIFTARQALKNGMIDKIGGLNDAVLLARKAAKLDACYYITLPRQRTLLDFLGGSNGASSRAGESLESVMMKRFVRKIPSLAYLLSLADLFQKESILTAMPHYFTIKQ